MLCVTTCCDYIFFAVICKSNFYEYKCACMSVLAGAKRLIKSTGNAVHLVQQTNVTSFQLAWAHDVSPGLVCSITGEQQTGATKININIVARRQDYSQSLQVEKL